MKLFVTILILALAGSSFAVSSVGNFSDPAYPGKCVFNNLVLSPGDYYQTNCTLFYCANENSLSSIDGCGVQIASPPCKLGDYVKPYGQYPDCCEQEVICPEE